MNNSTKCCFCGWNIPKGKGNSAVPADMTDGALCCNWCSEHIVEAARAAVEKVIFDMSTCTVEEQKKIFAEKQAVND